MGEFGRRSTAECARERQGIALRDRLVTSQKALDEAVSELVEHCWEGGQPLYRVSAALRGLYRCNILVLECLLSTLNGQQCLQHHFANDLRRAEAHCFRP